MGYFLLMNRAKESLLLVRASDRKMRKTKVDAQARLSILTSKVVSSSSIELSTDLMSETSLPTYDALSLFSQLILIQKGKLALIHIE